jgi:hypothetical protein
MNLGPLKLNGKSVLVKYDDLPRKRDSSLIRFPFSGNLIKKLCVLWELCERPALALRTLRLCGEKMSVKSGFAENRSP